MAKKRGNGEGTIRQRPDGRWEARYTVGTNPGTGKEIRKSIYGKTQDEVRKALQKVCATINDGTYIEPSKLTVGEWLDVWKDEYLVGVKRSTVISYTQHIKNHLKPGFGAVKLMALKPAAVQKFYNKKLKDGLSAKTIKNLHGVFHRALKQSVLLGYLRANPSDNCILPRIEKKNHEPLDTPEMEVFLKTLKGNPLEALFKVDIFTGMRQGEILGLQWDCVDFERGQIVVNKQLCRPRQKGDKYAFGPLKNDKARTITPAPYVMDILRAHKRAQLEQRMRAGELWDEGEFKGLVFTNEVGKHLVYAIVLRHFEKLLKQAGIDKRRFHDLRHTYATLSLRSGDDEKTVQENLGHHTAAFTLDFYGHVTETMRRESAQRMEAYISGLDKG